MFVFLLNFRSINLDSRTTNIMLRSLCDSQTAHSTDNYPQYKNTLTNSLCPFVFAHFWGGKGQFRWLSTVVMMQKSPSSVLYKQVTCQSFRIHGLRSEISPNKNGLSHLRVFPCSFSAQPGTLEVNAATLKQMWHQTFGAVCRMSLGSTKSLKIDRVRNPPKRGVQSHRKIQMSLLPRQS